MRIPAHKTQTEATEFSWTKPGQEMWTVGKPKLLIARSGISRIPCTDASTKQWRTFISDELPGDHQIDIILSWLITTDGRVHTPRRSPAILLIGLLSLGRLAIPHSNVARLEWRRKSTIALSMSVYNGIRLEEMVLGLPTCSSGIYRESEGLLRDLLLSEAGHVYNGLLWKTHCACSSFLLASLQRRVPFGWIWRKGLLQPWR